ncbi:MAG: hypothetical protein FJ267_01540 [Planctomycetes bacterium]|nr:hypothetical protein [Planctomycetota bacterium]
MPRELIPFFIIVWFTSAALNAQTMASDLSLWTAQPDDWKPAVLAEGKVALTADKWSFLFAPEEHAHVELTANVTIVEAAKQLRFFGESWSAWPDPTFGDGGFEAGVLVHGAKDLSSGFRVQLSHKYQCVALVKYPEGGYLRVVPCEVKLNQPIAVSVVTHGHGIMVKVDGQQKITLVNVPPLLKSGRVAIGTSSHAKVEFDKVSVTSLEQRPPLVTASARVAQLSVRRWLGDRQWVFDHNEPILQLHNERDPSCFAKLMPGDKPRLTFDSHWGLENQGAFPDAASKWTEPVVSGGVGHVVVQEREGSIPHEEHTARPFRLAARDIHLRHRQRIGSPSR